MFNNTKIINKKRERGRKTCFKTLIRTSLNILVSQVSFLLIMLKEEYEKR